MNTRSQEWINTRSHPTQEYDDLVDPHPELGPEVEPELLEEDPVHELLEREPQHRRTRTSTCGS
jgi:hypothetical protein